MTNDTPDLESMQRRPMRHFANPREVTERSDLTHEQKAAILDAWARHCDAAATAASAGRPVQDDPGDRGEVERAAERLAELRGE
ncbi:MAG: hypothetical protein RLW61_08845 [Gammaproteobacteria bacterium]